MKNSDDCDDDDDDNHLGAEEVCDEEDNNCNGEVDENAIDAITYYIDSDGDGFGNPRYIDDGIVLCLKDMLQTKMIAMTIWIMVDPVFHQQPKKNVMN